MHRAVSLDPTSRFTVRSSKFPRARPAAVERLLIQQLGDRREAVWIWSRKGWIGNVIQAADFGTQIANIVWMIVLVVTRGHDSYRFARGDS